MVQPVMWTLAALSFGASVAAILLTQGALRDTICGANSLGVLGWVYWRSSVLGEPLAPGLRWWALAAALLLLAGMIHTVPLALRGGAP